MIVIAAIPTADLAKLQGQDSDDERAENQGIDQVPRTMYEHAVVAGNPEIEKCQQHAQGNLRRDGKRRYERAAAGVDFGEGVLGFGGHVVTRRACAGCDAAFDF